MRRTRRRNRQINQNQGELFATWRHHALFTDSTFVLVQAEAQHRGHAVIEQANADLIDGPLAHLPSGDFAANAAWLTLAGIAHNLTRAAGHPAAPQYGKARATIRHEFIQVAVRLAHSTRRLILHLPERWPCQHAWDSLFTAVHAPPA